MTINMESSILPAHYTLYQRTLLLGLLIGIYPLGQLIGSPILGALSDRYGRRLLLLITLPGAMLTYLAMAMSVTPFSLTSLATALFFAGFAEGNVVIAQSSIADISNESNRTTRFAYISVAASLAFVVGPLLGAFLSDPTIVTWFSLATPFWFATLFFAILIVWIYCSYRETLPREAREDISIGQSFLNLKLIFTHPRLRPYFLVNLFAYLGVFGFFRLFPQYLVNQYQISHNWLCLSMVNLDGPIVLISLFLIAPMVRRYRISTLLSIAMLILALGTVLMLAFDTYPSTWITSYIAAIGIAYTIPISTSILSEQVETKEQGRILGNNTSLMVFAQMSAGWIAILFTSAGFKMPLIFCALSLIAGALLANRLRDIKG